MKFSEMKSTRPDVEPAQAALADYTQRFKAAESYAEAREIFLAVEEEMKHFQTMAELAGIRHSIDTRDEF